MLTALITSRLGEMAAIADEISKGNFEMGEFNEKGNDEVSQLSSPSTGCAAAWSRPWNSSTNKVVEIAPMKLMPAPLNLSVALVALTLALPAPAQTNAHGRALFKQKNCALCHSHEARSIAPSVKKMKAGLKGDPARTAAAISAAPGHANELGSVTAADIRAMSEWLAETTFDEQAAAQAAAPKPGSPEAKRLAAAKAKEDAAAR